MLAHLKRGFPHQKIFLSKKFCLIKFETYIPEESRTVCDCKWRHPEQCEDGKILFFFSSANSSFKPDKGTDTGGACENKGWQNKEANKGGPEEAGT